MHVTNKGKNIQYLLINFTFEQSSSHFDSNVFWVRIQVPNVNYQSHIFSTPGSFSLTLIFIILSLRRFYLSSLVLIEARFILLAQYSIIQYHHLIQSLFVYPDRHIHLFVSVSYFHMFHSISAYSKQYVQYYKGILVYILPLR